MSPGTEKLQHSTGENINPAESPNNEQIRKPETENRQAEAEKEHGEKSQIEDLHTKAVEKAASTEEHMSGVEFENKNQHPVLINKQLKDMAYSRALTRTRKHLSASSRLFSKVIHSKALDRPSEAVGRTIARPSSMLGGAMFALIGTSLLLWITKKQGYEYNYLAVVILFTAGMVVGLAAESLYRLLRRRS